MGIQFNEKDGLFRLDTRSTSYVIKVTDEDKFLGHVYYGPKVSDLDLSYLLRTEENPYQPSVNNRDRLSFYDSFPMEYSGNGLGDFREESIAVRTPDGHTAVKLEYISYKIYSGKEGISGLPATFGSKEECTSLELICLDPVLNLEVTLVYTAFEEADAITRSVRIRNLGTESLFLTRVMSFSIDMDNRDFDLITLHGSWARERHIQRKKIGYGVQGVSSCRGESGHQDHPFLGVLEHSATQEAGSVYGFSLVYSGNFLATVQENQFSSLRILMGINPHEFTWKLESGDEFLTPEVAMVYSANGIGGMSRSFHDLFRNHLIRSPYKDKKRPVIINNWEATYFDFNTEKLLGIARTAASLGVEMLVMDDGWFGNRDSDNMALGDWEVNEEKISGGLHNLVKEINALGMEFGIWFEPEMISPDSELYRQHPDWAIGIPGRERGLARNQYVLDFSREEVVNHIFAKMERVLNSANITYVKWDMNRPLSDLGSLSLPADRQGELSHRYMLGVYRMQEMLLEKFPHILLENCSGGGARFDPGMLYYSPQIWCSDDTDAIERLSIQEGTALIYPLSAMGAHVSDCPNHTVGRVTPFATRGLVALAGTFGYELDVEKISQEDRQQIPGQIAMYHAYNDLIRTGDYYRLASYSDNHSHDCIQIVSKDKKESLVTFIQVLGVPNGRSRNLRLQGLDPQKRYRIRHLEGTDFQNEPDSQQNTTRQQDSNSQQNTTSQQKSDGEWILSGDTLMHAGILVKNMWGDFQGCLFHIREIN